MKLLRVSFENVNSLAGKWTIDFEDPVFQDGLFLIAGDTGAGKTTILDAISLALYGRTVREDVTNGRNEVMTRGRGTAFAEAEFWCESGRFVARWEQARARGKAGARLQNVKMNLRDATSGIDISAHRVADTQRLIVAKIGLTFEQFQRTMMLAQGKFDQFLSAKNSARSEILQQATGTEIYAKVGEEIFRRKQESDAKVKELETKLGEQQTLDVETRTSLEADYLAKQDELSRVREELKAADDVLKDYRQKKVNAEVAETEEKNRSVTVGRSAGFLAQAQETVKVRAAAKDAARQQKNTMAAPIEMAIALKQKLLLARQNQEAKGKALAASKKAHAACSRKVEMTTEAIARTRALANVLRKVLEECVYEPTIVAGKDAPLLAKAEGYVARTRAFAGKEFEIQTIKAALERAKVDYAAVESEYRLILPSLKAARDNARAALDLAVVVDKLETHRKHLEDGKPCPLCGSPTHPYAAGNRPIKNACQLALETAEADLKKLDDKRNAALASRSDAESRLQKAENAVANERQVLESLKDEMDAARIGFEAMIEALCAQLADEQGAVTMAEADLDEKTLEEAAALRARSDAQTAYAALGLGEDPDVLRERLQQTCDAETAAWNSANAAAAIAEANLKNAETEHRAAVVKRLHAYETLKKVEEILSDPVAKEAELVVLGERDRKLSEELVAIDIRLRLDDEKRERKAQLRGDLDKAEERRLKWGRLNGWLGGLNGEKFKRYAQGITLRQLLKASNPHLVAMTQGRYEMTWNPESDDASELLPYIVDRDQGGEMRPVSNLSGGERFQVSLALALGLSAMSSDRLSVDTLFLDEGFGTLDGKNLESALDTLCRLQQDGKLIGVISHVTEVGERITTQIEVNKVGGGLSVLAGAGVSNGTCTEIA